MHTYIHANIHAYIHAYIHARTPTHVRERTHAHTHARTQKATRTHIHECTHAQLNDRARSLPKVVQVLLRPIEKGKIHFENKYIICSQWNDLALSLPETVLVLLRPTGTGGIQDGRTTLYFHNEMILLLASLKQSWCCWDLLRWVRFIVCSCGGQSFCLPQLRKTSPSIPLASKTVSRRSQNGPKLIVANYSGVLVAGVGTISAHRSFGGPPRPIFWPLRLFSRVPVRVFLVWLARKCTFSTLYITQNWQACQFYL